jgi:hypothetical protein
VKSASLRPLQIEIGGPCDHVPNRHAAGPRQHERHHLGHFAGLHQTSQLPDFLQLLPAASPRASALIAGPGEIEPMRMPQLNTWSRTVRTTQLTAIWTTHKPAPVPVGKWAAIRGYVARDGEVSRPMSAASKVFERLAQARLVVFPSRGREPAKSQGPRLATGTSVPNRLFGNSTNCQSGSM